MAKKTSTENGHVSLEKGTSNTAWVQPRYLWAAGLAAALLSGTALRLLWVMDMEYKVDETWTFEHTQQVGVTEPFRWLGMPSSVGIPNPGMSFWVFLLVSKVFALHTPTGLVRAVQVSNILTLVLLVVFALRCVSREEREPWLWAAALGAVNPVAVVFQRKLWSQSVLPIFTCAFLLGWWNRDRRWGAFFWGLMGALLGQIHMSGLFFAGGFCAWAACFDRKNIAWLSWLSGSILGTLPMFPWIGYLVAHAGDPGLPSGSSWHNLLLPNFWGFWLTESFGLGLEYCLDRDFVDFLRYPLLGGWFTYLVAVLHTLLVVIAGVVMVRSVWHLWDERSRWGTLWAGTNSPTAFTQNAALWGFGLLLTATGGVIHRHYLIVAFPLTFLFLARQALANPRNSQQALRLSRVLLLALCVGEFLVSASFLGYIHTNQRPIQGDFGSPYGSQR